MPGFNCGRLGTSSNAVARAASEAEREATTGTDFVIDEGKRRMAIIRCDLQHPVFLTSLLGTVPGPLRRSTAALMHHRHHRRGHSCARVLAHAGAILNAMRRHGMLHFKAGKRAPTQTAGAGTHAPHSTHACAACLSATCQCCHLAAALCLSTFIDTTRAAHHGMHT